MKGQRKISILLIVAMLLGMLPQMQGLAQTAVQSQAVSAVTDPESGFEFSKLEGVVRDAQGLGVEGVSVLLYDLEEERAVELYETDESGSWCSEEYEVIAGHTYSIRYYKAGYEFSKNQWLETAAAEGTAVTDVTAAETMSEAAVCNPEDYTYTIEGDGAVIEKYTGADEYLLIPSELGGYPVTVIGSSSFRKCTAVKEIYFPEGLQVIENHAFYQASGLGAVVLPNSLQEIQMYAFCECSQLETVQLPDGVETFGGNVFTDCGKLCQINYPRGLTTAGSGSFSGCEKLISITVPEGVTILPAQVFSMANCLQEVHLPDSLKTIGADAFDRCESLTEIALPEGLTEIDTGAFQRCSKLTQVVLPDSVENIRASAFLNCSNLESITIPLNWAYGGSQIFSGCEKLKTVRVPEGMTKLPAYAFHSAAFLESVELPDSLTEIGSSAFWGCTALTAVELPDSLRKLGSQVFYGCSSLMELNYPMHLEASGSNNYQGCTNLTEMTVPEGVEKIPMNAFCGSDCLEKVVIPQTVTSIGLFAFNSCEKLVIHGLTGSYAQTYALENEIPFYSEGVVTVYASVSGRVVTEDGEGLAGVRVSPYNLTRDEAYETTLLTDADGVWRIPRALAGEEYRIRFGEVNGYTLNPQEIICTVSEEGTVTEDCVASELPKTYVTVGGCVKEESGSPLEGVIIYLFDKTALSSPDGQIVTDADGRWEFTQAVVGHCYEITYQKTGYQFDENSQSYEITEAGLSLEILAQKTETPPVGETDPVSGDYVYTIEEEKAVIKQYTGTDGKVEVPSELGGYPVVGIEYSAFRDNSALEELILPEGLTEIGISAFFGCSGLVKVSLPESVKVIDGHAFRGCVSLTELSLPDGVEKLGAYAFAECTGLEALNYPSELQTAGGNLFDGCEKLKKMVVPEGVEIVAEQVFSGAEFIETVELPSTVTEIGREAFANCVHLQLPTLPEGLTKIHAYAFEGCEQFTEVCLPDSMTEIGAYAFADCENLEVINYPAGWKAAGTGIFEGCKKLRSIAVPEGVTKIPDHAFSRASGLRTVQLPETLTEIGASAFSYCEELRTVTIPSNAELIGEQAFYHCTRLEKVQFAGLETKIEAQVFEADEKLILYCKEFSGIVYEAIRAGIPFKLLPTNGAGYVHPAVISESSGIHTPDSFAQIEDTVQITVSYEVSKERFALLTEPKLVIALTQNLELTEHGVWINGLSVTDYGYQDGLLTIPLTEAKGAVHFTVTPVEAGMLAVHAQLTFEDEGQLQSDRLGVLCLEQPVMKLNVPNRSSQKSFEVTGFCKGGETVVLAVEGEESVSIKAKQDGTFTAELSLPENAIYGETYRVTAALQSDQEVHTEVEILYDQDAPVLTRFTMYYGGGFSEQIELAGTEGSRLINSIYPGNPYKFHIQFENGEKIAKVYVVSKKNGVLSRLQATASDTPGEYIAEGYFEGTERTYVPGTINVYYTTVTDVESYGKFPDDAQSIPAWMKGAAYEVQSGLSEVQVQQILLLADAKETVCFENTLLVRDVKENAIRYLVKDSLKGTYDGVRIQLLESVDIYEVCEEAAQKLSRKAWSMSDGEEVLAYPALEHLIALEEAAGELEVSDILTAEEKSAGKELAECLQWGYGALQILRYAAAQEETVFEDHEWIIADCAKAVFGLAEELAREYLETSLACDAAGGRGTHLRWLIDPSGYVYNERTKERLEGVTVTAYQMPYEEEGALRSEKPSKEEYGELWNAEEYSQSNPIVTGADGCYAWDVPEGWWRVKYEKEGFETAWSDWMPVPPAQTEVNIGMTPVETETPTEPEIVFADVPQHAYYYEPVLWAVEREVTSGYTKEEFAPEVNCTRSQVVTFLWRAMGKPQPGSRETQFTDLEIHEYYYDAVLWAVEAGITTGYDTLHFAPYETVTRGQFVTFLYRALGEPEYSVQNPFVDVPEAAYYYDAVLWALEQEITTGIYASEFWPEEFCTRGQVVTFLYRAFAHKE